MTAIKYKHIISVDRTFNLGPMFLTTTVYKHFNVLRTGTEDYPLFIGPMFLHWEASFQTYADFFW